MLGAARGPDSGADQKDRGLWDENEQVLESYLLQLVTRIYKATTLFKNLSETFRVYVLPYALLRGGLPFHPRGACVKTQVSVKKPTAKKKGTPDRRLSVLKPGYIVEGWKILVSSSQNVQNIAVSTKTTCHFKYTYPGRLFFQQISHGEC